MILTICIFGVLFSLCPFNSIATACAAGGAQSWSCNAFAWDPEDGRWKMWYLKHPKTSYLYNDFYCRFVGILRNGMCSSIFFLALVLTQPATWLSYKLSYKYLKMHQNSGMFNLRAQGPFRSELCVPCWHSDVGGRDEKNQNTMKEEKTI